MRLPNQGTGPAYQRIAADLRAQIISGELPPGAQLPTEHELAGHYDVARQTVRSGLQMLIREGLVVARRPRGHFVRHTYQMHYCLQESSFRGLQAEQLTFARRTTAGGHAAGKNIDVEIVKARPEVAERLRIEEGSTVVARRRVGLIDGHPVNTSDAYYPLEVVAGSPIMSPEDVEADTDQILVELGYPQVRATDEIFVRMPTPDEVHLLDLAPGTPVAVHWATGYTARGHPVRCTIDVLPGDRYRIVAERTLDVGNRPALSVDDGDNR